jgi:hypothetical protein
MKLLITEEEFSKCKSRQDIPLECEFCKKPFYIPKHEIQAARNYTKRKRGKFCSRLCIKNDRKSKRDTICSQCKIQFEKMPNQIAKYKNHFCSRRCAGIYNSKHKTKGFRRSKLEVWIEKELLKIYPQHKFLFNDRKTIGLELDIYLPDLSLAFELNGIFHYEPIFGKSKLDAVEYNDNQKYQACISKDISLCIVDSTSMKYFKPEKAKYFLDIITGIINKRIGA